MSAASALSTSPGRRRAVLCLALLAAALAGPSLGDGPDNPAIDMRGYLRAAHQAGVVVLDARSADKYAQLHVRGAVSLPFTDMTAESLARLVPDRRTEILIYCNNNFANAPGPFPTKLPTASLNLSTYIALWTYGYRNVYELGPLVDLAASKLAFESSAAASTGAP